MSGGKPRAVKVKASSGFVPVYTRFSQTPLSQISPFSLISSAGTLNPNTANTSVKLEAGKMEDFQA